MSSICDTCLSKVISMLCLDPQRVGCGTKWNQTWDLQSIANTSKSICRPTASNSVLAPSQQTSIRKFEKSSANKEAIPIRNISKNFLDNHVFFGILEARGDDLWNCHLFSVCTGIFQGSLREKFSRKGTPTNDRGSTIDYFTLATKPEKTRRPSTIRWMDQVCLIYIPFNLPFPQTVTVRSWNMGWLDDFLVSGFGVGRFLLVGKRPWARWDPLEVPQLQLQANDLSQRLDRTKTWWRASESRLLGIILNPVIWESGKHA